MIIDKNSPAEVVWPHMQNPQMKSCFNRGFKSFYKGWLENPYKPYSDKAKEWERGFNAAYFKNKS